MVILLNGELTHASDSLSGSSNCFCFNNCSTYRACCSINHHQLSNDEWGGWLFCRPGLYGYGWKHNGQGARYGLVNHRHFKFKHG